ncbi:TetR/AcrR family transcriptional regulator [Rhodococcus sp. C26F]
MAAALFAEHGFGSTTVRQIANAAGVRSGSLYHHFDSKEAIVDEILSRYFAGMLATYRDIIDHGADPATTLRRLVAAGFYTLETHRAAITVVQNERSHLGQTPRFGYLIGAEDHIRQMWIGVLEDGMEQGVFHREMDPSVVYRFLRDSLWVTVRWFTPDSPIPTAALAAQYLELVMGGMNARSRTHEQSEQPGASTEASSAPPARNLNSTTSQEH